MTVFSLKSYIASTSYSKVTEGNIIILVAGNILVIEAAHDVKSNDHASAGTVHA